MTIVALQSLQFEMYCSFELALLLWWIHFALANLGTLFA